MINYECERCGKCCQWPGEVVISEKEIRAMAEDLDITPFDFTQKHTQIRASRNGLTLKQDEKGSCVLLKNNSCSVHSSKPQQCKDFPNKWRFKGWRQICEATPKEISE